MDKKNGEKLNYIVEEDVNFGSVKIADDVVAMIASVAAKEVEGVVGCAGNVGNDILSKVGIDNKTKGVKVDIKDKDVRVDIAITVDYAYNIPTVSSKVQNKVKQAIENMTGLTVTDVNVRIAGVNVNAR